MNGRDYRAFNEANAHKSLKFREFSTHAGSLSNEHHCKLRCKFSLIISRTVSEQAVGLVPAWLKTF